MVAPLILALRFDDTSVTPLDSLRRRHFPPERNMIPARLTLFHALPGEHEADVAALLRRLAASTPTLVVRFPAVRFLGRGVALVAEYPELVALRRVLARHWHAWLGNQDRQGFTRT